jgi:ABC-type nitrate/sulfonate/bicarbonate transport system ATPase subunit
MADPISAAKVEVQDWTVRRGSRVVLNRVSLHAVAGEFVVVCGGSGSGKSTLLLGLGGFIPSEGKLSVRGRLGVVWQSPSETLFSWKTVAGNIQFALRDHCPIENREKRLSALLAQTGLTPLADKYPPQLSGGEAQRLGVARALATDAEILLLDEPFSALDWFRRRSLQDWLLGLWQEDKKLVIHVTHDVEEAVLLATKIWLLTPGKTVTEIVVPQCHPRPREWMFSNEFNDLKKQVASELG